MYFKNLMNYRRHSLPKRRGESAWNFTIHRATLICLALDTDSRHIIAPNIIVRHVRQWGIRHIPYLLTTEFSQNGDQKETKYPEAKLRAVARQLGGTNQKSKESTLDLVWSLRCLRKALPINPKSPRSKIFILIMFEYIKLTVYFFRHLPPMGLTRWEI
jgi:hypothetical protein